LALASLTGGDRSIDIVRLRTKTTKFFFFSFNFKHHALTNQAYKMATSNMAASTTDPYG
jgi:hypothetical protein